MQLKNYTSDELREVIKESFAYRQVLIKLNVGDTGGNYASLKKKIKRFNIDISHFTHQRWSRGKKLGYRIPVEDYLSNKHPISTDKLKKRLIKEKILDKKCYSCNLTEWMGETIPIQLHHIDGNRQNNNLTNITILCPNCHALTDNWKVIDLNKCYSLDKIIHYSKKVK